jgi:predicted  nucleic acid-binding Zn-ribbon protein
MNILKDRTTWIAIFILTLGGLYYWLIIDQERVDDMTFLEESDFELTGDVTEWSEKYNRLLLKWRGTSKHVKTLQDETSNHYVIYNAKVDSVNNTFEKIEFKLDQINENLSNRIDNMGDDLESLSEEFSSYKRTTQRDVRKINKTLEGLRQDIEALSKKVEEEL